MTRLVLLGAVHRDPSGKHRLKRVIERLSPAAVSLEVSPASVAMREELGAGWRRLFRQRLGEISEATGLSRGRLMAGAGLRGVFEYIRLPYEYRAAREYAYAKGRPLFLMDDSSLAQSYLGQVEDEILTLENLTLLHEASGGERLEEDVQAAYHRAAEFVFGDAPELTGGPWLKDPEGWEQREAGLGQKIRLLHQGLVRRAGRSMEGEEFISSLIVSPEAVAYVPDEVTLPENGVHLYIGGWEHLIDNAERRPLFTRLKNLEPERMLCFNHNA